VTAHQVATGRDNYAIPALSKDALTHCEYCKRYYYQAKVFEDGHFLPPYEGCEELRTMKQELTEN